MNAPAAAGLVFPATPHDLGAPVSLAVWAWHRLGVATPVSGRVVAQAQRAE